MTLSASRERLPSCSVIIATLDRLDSLQVVLTDLAQQTLRPVEVIIAAAGDAAAVTALTQRLSPELPIRVLASPVKSSARQRNLAAAEAQGEILAFLDDDIEFGPELFASTLANFVDPSVGAVSPRATNWPQRRPAYMVRRYFRLQAAYDHPDYGARLFGLGLNCYPIFGGETYSRQLAEWLPATCLFVRATAFNRHRFPSFTGYSYAEDVHLTARIARETKLYFLSDPVFVHHSLPSEFKANRADLTAGKLHNMAIIARDILGFSGWAFQWRWHLHRVFMLATLIVGRPRYWREEIKGVLMAKP